MSVPVPLGVRLINAWGRPFDVWVTRLVDDISFRSVIPGGFANATLTIHNDHSASWDLITQPLTRVQIVDLRSQEIAWEGHIDSRRRNTAADTWELGCLGSMALASDITRPMFYIDSDVGNFSIDDGATAPTVNPSSNAATRSLTMAPIAGSYTAQRFTQQHVWDRARGCNLYVGRVDATFTGSAGSASFRTGIDIGANNDLLRAWNASSSRLTARVGSGITGTTAAVVTVAWDISGTASITAGQFGKLELPRIQVQRVDETGAKLQTSGDYPQEYLTVEQIVRDVVGRFLVGAWHTGANNTPYHGMVGSEGIYIDTSSTKEITHLTYYDGVTAAKILTDLMEAQPEAYWAIWESRFGATTDGNADARHRFEWAVWPPGYTYHATSIDGLEEQPDGGDLANFVWFTHALASDPELHNVQTVWDSGTENAYLTDAQRVRGVTIQAEDPMDAIPAFDRAVDIHESLQRTTNAGTLTVKRPIFAYDPGSNSASGMARMLDPWLIRPGKLIRITDIPPRGNSNTFGTGSTAFAPELDGTVFRVVGTTYNSSDNSCVLELDKPPAWDTATQVLESGSGSSNLVVRG